MCGRDPRFVDAIRDGLVKVGCHVSKNVRDGDEILEVSVEPVELCRKIDQPTTRRGRYNRDFGKIRSKFLKSVQCLAWPRSKSARLLTIVCSLTTFC